MLEALFHLQRITADDSWHYLMIVALDQQSTHLLRAPLLTKKYAAPKQLLLRRYRLSATERADKLLSLPGLGDGSAVKLMDNILSLVGLDESAFLFPQIFLQLLWYVQLWQTLRTWLLVISVVWLKKHFLYCCLLGVFTFVKWCQIPCSQLCGLGNVDWSFCPEVVGRPVLLQTASQVIAVMRSQGLVLRPSMHVPGDRKRQSQHVVEAMGAVNKRSCFCQGLSVW